MAASDPTLAEIRDRFDRAFAKLRQEAMIFSVTTVILTPVFFAVAVFIALAALFYMDVPYVHGDCYASTFVTGMTVLLVFMFATFFIRPKAKWQTSKSDLYWIGAGIVVLALLLVWTYATGLQESNPTLFWVVYTLLSITILGLVGHAYVPHDSYYLGWLNGGMDDPFTLHDDVDRGHFALGFAVAFPRLILGSYGALFSDLWIWKGIGEEEARTAAGVLHALATIDRHKARTTLGHAPPGTRGRVLRILDRLGYIRAENRDLRLTAAGEKFVGTGSWF